MAYAAIPVYIGLSATMCLGYNCIKCAKYKGKLDSFVKSINVVWILGVILISSLLCILISQIMMRRFNFYSILIFFMLIKYSSILSDIKFKNL